MSQSQYFSVLTNAGRQANINAKATKTAIKLSKIAFGSGGITPSATVTALAHEEFRTNINSIVVNAQDSNVLEIEALIPSDVGGFLINEAAIYLEDETLYAVASLPQSYKPLLTEGSAKELVFTIYLASVGVENVTLKVDDSVVLATRKYLHNELTNYAKLAGSETQNFKVAAATQNNEAVNKAQLNEIDTKIKNLRAAVSDGVMKRIGYITLPSELKVQWGNVGIASGRRSTRVFFPIRFPTFCFVVVPAGGDSTYGNWRASDLNPESFIYHTDCSNGQVYRWLALGY